MAGEMQDRQTDATWTYHDGTKHPDGPLMDRWHSFDPMRHPMLLKIYADLEAIPLPLDKSSLGVAALTAISTSASPTQSAQVPDIGTLARLLYYSAGVTKRLNYPWGEMLFRAAACTGALYHIELYLVCGDLPGLDAGVYHFDPAECALRPLRQGDYRRALADASGQEPSVVHAPAIIVYTDVFWRNACKYQSREYRHAFWDSGTILAHTLAMASAHDVPASVVAGFVDSDVAQLLDLDTQREVAVALVPIGHTSSEPPPCPEVEPLSLTTVPISDNEADFPAIRDMHEASSLGDGDEVASWRGEAPEVAAPFPGGQVLPLAPHLPEEMPQDAIESVIVRRGSSRRFAQDPITLAQLSTALVRATGGVAADFLEPHGAMLSHLYLIVNSVDGLQPGGYVFHKDRQSVELLRPGEFRREAGYLGLNQALPADASVDVFLMTDLNSVLDRFGNRGYRAAQLDASITAGKLYLAAYAQGFGATGLTFYDDAVTEFFSPHASGKSAMFMVALGKRARRE